VYALRYYSATSPANTRGRVRTFGWRERTCVRRIIDINEPRSVERNEDVERNLDVLSAGRVFNGTHCTGRARLVIIVVVVVDTVLSGDGRVGGGENETGFRVGSAGYIYRNKPCLGYGVDVRRRDIRVCRGGRA